MSMEPGETVCVTRREFGAAALGCLGAATVTKPARTRQASGFDCRADFDILARRQGRTPLVYLDSAATSQRPNVVIDAIADFYRGHNANPSVSSHSLARGAQQLYEDSRRSIAEFINAYDASEIVFTRGTTEAINLVAAAWGGANLKAGDEILLTISEHASNLLPWRLVTRQHHAVVRFANVDEAGRIDVADFRGKLSSRTRLAAFSHVSNVAGFVNPAAELCALARAAGALTLVDAAQSAPHVPIDVRQMSCDFLAFSSHKMLGPMGSGVLFGRRELLDRLAPYQSGSNMAHDVDLEFETLESGAKRFGAGTPNVSGAIGMAVAARYLQKLRSTGCIQHEERLVAYALGRLTSIPGLRLLGPRSPEDRTPVFTFVVESHDVTDLARALDESGIAVRAGDLSALPLLRHFGVTRALRASGHVYNSREDIDRLAEGLRYIVNQ
jgi:cysteine desulfurase / selenocysteine lyase